jgi:hypothetical protein
MEEYFNNDSLSVSSPKNQRINTQKNNDMLQDKKLYFLQIWSVVQVKHFGNNILNSQQNLLNISVIFCLRVECQPTGDRNPDHGEHSNVSIVMVGWFNYVKSFSFPLVSPKF